MFRCRRRCGFTLIEILVVILVIGVLIAMLLPAIQSARAVARRTACANNQWQVGRGFQNYLSVHTTVPDQNSLCTQVAPFCEQEASIWLCPELPPDQTVSFAFNNLPPKYQPDESNYVVLLDGNQCTINLTLADTSWIPIVDERHLGVANVLHFDGHVDNEIVLNPQDTAAALAAVASTATSSGTTSSGMGGSGATGSGATGDGSSSSASGSGATGSSGTGSTNDSGGGGGQLGICTCGIKCQCAPGLCPCKRVQVSF